jgi:hypothetical protein
MLKTLLLQLLHCSIGDDDLVEGLWHTYEQIHSQRAKNPEELLWKTLQEALGRQKRETVIIIDGLDQVDGGDDMALQISNKIKKICAQRRNLRCVLFSRSFYPGPLLPSGFCGLPIGPSDTRNDINRYIERWIARSEVFLLLKVEERKTLVKQLRDLTLGTFMEAKLLLQLLQREINYEAMIRTLHGAPETPTGMIELLCSHIDYTKRGTLEILSLLLVVKRPLQLKEVKTWIELSLKTGSNQQIKNIKEYISSTLGFIVEFRGNTVKFVHPLIKQHLLATPSHFPAEIRDINRDMAIRCLTYIKKSLRDLEIEPSVDYGLASDALQTFQRSIENDTILEYSLQYYLSHYKASSLFSNSGDHKTPPEFRACFPDSILLAFVERNMLEANLSSVAAEEFHFLALNIRKLTFGSHGKSTIQSYLNVGRCRQKLLSFAAAAEFFYEAWSLCQRLLEKYGRACIGIAKVYIDIVTLHPESFGKDSDIKIEKVYR